MALPTQTTHLHPGYLVTHLYPHHHNPYYPSARHPLPRPHSNTNNAVRPGTRGTLLVDWDGSGEPLLSYRGGDGAEDGDAGGIWEEEMKCEEESGEEPLLSYRCGDNEVVECEEEERGVREVLEEMMMDKGVEEKGKEMVKERKGEGEGEVQTGFLIRRKPVPVRQEGEEGKRDVDVGVGVCVDKAVLEVGKRLPEVPGEKEMERLPIFYKYEEASNEREEVKKKENKGSVGRLAEVLKEEGSEVWGMLKYEGKELMAVLKHEGKELFEEVKEDGKELLEGWREEGRWLSVVLRREWRDGRVVVGKRIKKCVWCYV
ncbi:hypothetical protein COCSADRAFT_195823 [Bipolaris sorokiniana ND90Pr]|uniref:Uncharacterized protein n=1 Tax=Cochliobolus sativus (strain ND90Pr / ATCC 201652) TaxID=665912 RepID=M2SSF5_COCSN|nr:uncharacterized protein COCSADRAFT_195823 [Bipolaris sorokiniana ND90Pr]EMD70138.1 hypothetical protein COCSADRAFT_195823 [Bipolaris sorokiniana ND90Pr]